MDTGFILGAALVITLLLWWLASGRAASRKPFVSVLAEDVALTAVPLLTDAHVLVYNLLRLAVRDRYLVFAHVPLWSFVHVDATGSIRSRIFSQIALKQVDFALVHPGSRRVEQVVQIVEAPTLSHEAERRRIVKAVLDAVGIPLREVKPQQSYSVGELSAHLGLDVDE